MKLFKSTFILNAFCLFIISYLIYHTLYGNYNLQNYYISKFETKMFQDFNYTLQQELIMVNKDIYALGYNYPDMFDEISKRKNPFPVDGEILIKID